MEIKNIISFGGGVNSTAMILLMMDQGIRIDEIIMSDPKCERVETYKFLKIFSKFCELRNLKFTIIESDLGSIKDHYMERKIIPLRLFRSCTDLFKIRPIKKYLKKIYPDHEIKMFLGIDAGESHRAKEEFNYPLIDHNINRSGCKDLIRKHKLPIPIKSGCWFCPFQSHQEWINLYYDHPDQFDEAIAFEENCKRFPEFTLGRMKLRQLKHIIKTQTDLRSFIKQDPEVSKCVYCHD